MKMKTVLALLMMTLAFTACNDDETVSGEMKYTKGYELGPFSSFIPSGSDCAILLNTLQKNISRLTQNYNKEWSVSFSGTSIDSALAKADQEAVADFDAAVANLKSLQKEFEETVAKSDVGKGSFSITYVVRVKRDKVLKESEPIVFEYEYQK